VPEVCLKTSDFQFGDKFCQKKTKKNKRMAMAITDTYMECSKDMAMNRAVGKPSLWSRYVNGSFVFWKHIIEDLHNLFT